MLRTGGASMEEAKLTVMVQAHTPERIKEQLDIPFLFLSGGECKIMRRIGGALGCCMYLCVYEYDELATPVQPLLSDMKVIRDSIEEEGNKLEIIPVQYGRSVLAESMVFQHGAEDKFYPIVFLVYLMRMEDRLILVDAGCETMPGFDMQDFIGPVKAMEQMGLTPDNISDVIITHAHYDHIACVNRFRKATIYIQKDEYENGKEYFAKGQNVWTGKSPQAVPIV